MGGHFGGSLCSQKTIDYLFKYFYERFNKDINFDDKKAINK
ncbi:Uncharacterised protein [Mycoplasmopsis arginini]|nr:Uncharacterised protein [Chlamydia trachomatis]SGA10506.1 Uncharacterised protein [Mycoplasmopsis arginini]SGA19266.1 Uncharacterised protein [Mycoplasmopsis arginini]